MVYVSLLYSTWIQRQCSPDTEPGYVRYNTFFHAPKNNEGESNLTLITWFPHRSPYIVGCAWLSEFFSYWVGHIKIDTALNPSQKPQFFKFLLNRGSTQYSKNRGLLYGTDLISFKSIFDYWQSCVSHKYSVQLNIHEFIYFKMRLPDNKWIHLITDSHLWFQSFWCCLSGCSEWHFLLNFRPSVKLLNVTSSRHITSPRSQAHATHHPP